MRSGGVVSVRVMLITLLSQNRTVNYSARFTRKHNTIDTFGGVVGVVNYSAAANDSMHCRKHCIAFDKHFWHADVNNKLQHLDVKAPSLYVHANFGELSQSTALRT